jgi:hypothetical protein
VPVTHQPPPYLMVTFIVTYDGEQQHPMDAYAVRVDLDTDGRPTAEAVEYLLSQVSRAVVAKGARAPRQ